METPKGFIGARDGMILYLVKSCLSHRKPKLLLIQDLINSMKHKKCQVYAQEIMNEYKRKRYERSTN